MKPNLHRCLLVLACLALRFMTYGQCPLTETPFNDGQTTPNSVWFTSDNVGYVVGVGISKTTDGGKSWNSLVNAPRVYLRSSMFVNEKVGFITGPSPTQGGTVPIWKTTDGGKSWKATNTPADVTKTFYRGLYMVNENVGYAGLYTDGIIVKTTDGGENWVKVSPIGTSVILGLYFIDTEVGFAGTTTGLWMTKDGGKNWISKLPTQATGPFIYSVHFADPLNGYAVGEDYTNSPLNGGIYKTTDGGETWTLAARVMKRTKEVFALSPDTAYICGTDQLWVTFDAARTWNKVNSSAKAELYDIHFPFKRVGYAVGDGNGNVKITTDNAKPALTVIGGWTALTASDIPRGYL